MKDSIWEGNRGSLLWVLIIILVLLLAALAAALKFMPRETTPEPRAAVARAKVPPMPAPAASPPPQAAPAPAPPAGEQGSTTAAPAAEVSPVLQSAAEAGTPNPITAASEKPSADKSVQDSQPPPPSGQAPEAKEAALPLAPPPVAPPKTAVAPAPPKPDTAAAQDSPSPAAAPKAAAKKPKEKPLARVDLDQMAPYTIQVGAFRNKANADEVISRLAKKGYAPFIFQVTDAEQRSFYMVRFGQYQSREEAARALEAFKRKEKQDAVIVRSGLM